MNASEIRFSGCRHACLLSPRTSGSIVVMLVFLLFLSFTGCTIGGESKHPTWKKATGAEQYERLLWEAIRDQDWRQVEYRLAPTFVGVNSKGQVLDREGWVHYWKTAQMKEFSLGEVSVQPNGPDMTVTYLMHTGAEGAGWRVVSVWQQVKGGWTLVATSITPVSPA